MPETPGPRPTKAAGRKTTAARRTAAKKTAAKPAAGGKAAAEPAAGGKAAEPAGRAAAEQAAGRRAATRKSGQKGGGKKAGDRKGAGKKAAAKKTTAQNTTAQNTAGRKGADQTPAAEKTTAAKTAAKRAAGRKRAGRKAAGRKSADQKAAVTTASRTSTATTAAAAKAAGRAAERPRKRTASGRSEPERLTVAVTGPTGTFGAGLVPLLEREPRVARVIGIARRPFRPAERGWSKMTYRRGDVRDAVALREAFAGADVVVHLAFVVTGNASRRTIREINVDGTLRAFRAAAASGVRRFVYASSVAAYGFHGDNPIGMTEDWPVRPADRLFYAREKAELEQALATEARRHPGLDLYLLRPSIVVGPDVLGGKAVLPGPLRPLNRFVPDRPRRLPVPVVLPVPLLTMQLVHESDVGQALLRCTLGEGPPGAYNIAGDGTVTAADVARAFGVVPVPLPAGPVRGAARLVSRLPLLPPAAEWAEAAAHPSIMDTTRAKTELGWVPSYTALAALEDTVFHRS